MKELVLFSLGDDKPIGEIKAELPTEGEQFSYGGTNYIVDRVLYSEKHPDVAAKVFLKKNFTATKTFIL